MRISGYTGCEDCQAPPGPAPARSASEAPSTRGGRFAAQANQSTKAELSLTTAEGDKVVLSVSSESGGSVDAASSSDYRSLRTTNRRSLELKIEVEGNLSQTELDEIRKLASIVSKASSDVLRGRTSQAAADVAKTSELATIQNFAFSLNKQVDYRYSFQSGSLPPQSAGAPA